MTGSDESSQAGPPSAAQGGEREGERIAKVLARAGVASRREIERMIAEGRIALDGVAITTPATLLTGLRGLTVDGKPVAKPERTRLFRFHKPAGLLTAERDPAGRPTIYAALRNALPPGTPRMMPIGRLDLNTEGLLLLTNDGEFKRLLELPANGVPRTYRARTFGEISQAQLEELIHGVTVEGVNYGRIDANLERRTGRNQWIELTLTEGKNREVRRVLEFLGLQVSRLIRTAYGPFIVGDLRPGGAEEVRREDLERFRSSLKGAGPRRVAIGQRETADDDAPADAPAQAPAPQAKRPAPAPRKSFARPGEGGESRDKRPARPAARGARDDRRSPAGGGAADGRRPPRKFTARDEGTSSDRAGRPERGTGKPAPRGTQRRDDAPSPGARPAHRGSQRRDEAPSRVARPEPRGGQRRDDAPSGGARPPRGTQRRDDAPSGGARPPRGTQSRDDAPSGGPRSPRGTQRRDDAPSGGARPAPRGTQRRDDAPSGRARPDRGSGPSLSGGPGRRPPSGRRGGPK